MANNPYVNKVEDAAGNTIMDITDTTAVAGDVASGKVFYTASGTRTVGTSDLSEVLKYNHEMVYSPGGTRSSVLTNLNNAESNKLYHFLMASTSTLPDNYPSGASQLTEFLVITYEDEYTYQSTQYPYKIQYVLNSATYKAIAQRVYNDAWESWSVIGSGESDRIIVAADGSGQYTTLTAAVAASSNGDTIYVKKGTYDNEIVKAWGKNITIIGEDQYQTIIKNGYNDYERPPLEMDIGRLENLTLYQYDSGATPGQYGAGYGLHIEHNSMANGVFSASNVTFKSDLWTGAGIGLRPGCHAYFDHCIFWGNSDAGIFYHDCATGAVGVQNISFRSCIFHTVSGQYSMIINSQKFTGSTVYNTFVNCVVSNSSGTTPAINAVHASAYAGDATGPIGDFYKLINFYKGKENYGNNVPDLNYWNDGVSVYPKMGYLNGATDVIADLDDALPNSMYLINCSSTSQVPAHSPSGLAIFYVLTVNTSFVSSNTNYVDKMQYALDKTTMRPLRVREYVDSWSNWVDISVSVVNNLTSTSTTDALSANQGKVLNDNKVAKAGDTMTGNLIVSGAGEKYVKAENTTSGVAIYLDASTKNGLYSSGYNNGTSFVSSGKWILYRDSDGATHLECYDGLDGTSTTIPLSAKQGKVLYENINTTVISSQTSLATLVSNMSSGDVRNFYADSSSLLTDYPSSMTTLGATHYAQIKIAKYSSVAAIWITAVMQNGSAASIFGEKINSTFYWEAIPAALNSNMQWKNLDEKTGDAVFSFPSNFQELFVQVGAAGSFRNSVMLVIPKSCVNYNSDNYYRAGNYQSASVNSSAIIHVNSSGINLSSFYYNGSDGTSTAVVRVLYR